MTKPTRDTSTDAPLNPALKSETEKTFDTSPTPAPLETTGAKEGQGEGWPIVWLIITLICVAIAIYLIV